MFISARFSVNGWNLISSVLPEIKLTRNLNLIKLIISYLYDIRFLLSCLILILTMLILTVALIFLMLYDRYVLCFIKGTILAHENEDV